MYVDPEDNAPFLHRTDGEAVVAVPSIARDSTGADAKQ
jgi:hypothetical protein